MRLELTIPDDGRSLTITATGDVLGMPPHRLANAARELIATTLLALDVAAPLAEALDVPVLAPAPDLSPEWQALADQARPELETDTDELALEAEAEAEPGPEVEEEPDDAAPQPDLEPAVLEVLPAALGLLVPAPERPAHLEDDDELARLKAEAQRLLDEEGLDRAHVAARLGVSLAQVRRWDDDMASDFGHDELVKGLAG